MNENWSRQATGPGHEREGVFSDHPGFEGLLHASARGARIGEVIGKSRADELGQCVAGEGFHLPVDVGDDAERIGRASCRERV